MANIFDLPPELCVRIAKFLTTPELGCLRRTCKQIEMNLFDDFASEFFTKRQFMLEHVSLEALLGIANHPGLAAKLTEVIISTHHFGHPSMIEPDRLRRDELLQTGMACDMLADVFSKLPNLQHVGIRDYEAQGRTRDGRGASWKSWGWSSTPDPVTMMYHPDSMLPIILTALGKAGARPHSIQAVLRKTHLGPFAFTVPLPGTHTNVAAVLQNLKMLFLPLSMAGIMYSGGPGASYDDDNATERGLRRFLHHTSQLETLRLNFEPYENLAYHFLDWLGRRANISTPVDLTALSIPSAPLKNLRSLEIGMAFVRGPTLVQLLTKFDLTSFSLWKVTLECPGPINQHDPWSDFLQKLSTSLPSANKLRSIMIGEVRQRFAANPSLQEDITLFVPVDTDPDKKFKATNVKKVEYKRQYTAQTANAWLQELSTRTFVPGVHIDPSKPKRRSSRTDTETEEEDSDEYEEDEDEDEDEDMEDD